MPVAMRKPEKGKRLASPDPQEERALARAVTAAQKFQPGVSEAVVSVAISEWILARSSMAAGVRLNAELLFSLGDARLRGFIEAALPNIGATLEGKIPAGAPLFELSKEQIMDVFMAGIIGAQEAAVAANESMGFPFDDEVPF